MTFCLIEKTILRYLAKTILWYYMKHYWRTVFVPYGNPAVVGLLTALWN
jgi:hypothetical protein